MYFTIEICHFLYMNKKNESVQRSVFEIDEKLPTGYWFKNIVKNNRVEIRNMLKEFSEIQELSDKNWVNDVYYKISLAQLKKLKSKKLEDLLYNKALIRIWDEKPISTGTSG